MSDPANERIGRLLRAGRTEAILREVEAGTIDPVAVPEAIYRAVDLNDPTLLQVWLDAGVDPNWASRPRPLVRASALGRPVHVELLLAMGADPNADADTGGAFAAALLEGHDRIAVRLLQAGADPRRDLRGVGFLASVAVAGGLVATVRRWLDHGLEPDLRGTVDPLLLRPQASIRESTYWAARRHDAKLSDNERRDAEERHATLRVRQAEAIAAHAQGPKYQEATLLSIALGEGHDELVALLRAHGADEALVTSPAPPPELSSEEAADPLAQILAALGGGDVDGDAGDVAEGEESEDEEAEDDEWMAEAEAVELATLTPEQQAHFAPEAVVARLSAAAGDEAFRAAVERLEGLLDSRSEPDLDGAGVRLHVDSRSVGGRLLRAEGLDALRAALDAPGCLLVTGRRDAAHLLPTVDSLEAIAAFGVSGANVNVDSRQILAFFRDHPIELTTLRSDLVAGRLEPRPYDPADAEAVRTFAIHLYALCPDVIDQGFETLDALCASLVDGPTIHLWWD